jgi:inner membrane protein
LDNLTHSLVGLTAAKAGLERLSPGASLLCVLAANSPDSDIAVILFGDRWDYLQHHRGITHSIVGVVSLAILLPLIFYGVDRLWGRLRGQSPKTKLRGLLIVSFIVSATHPLLDWTNNYGVRFLLPWNPRWFYGDLVFIVDPFLWVVLGGAAFLLASKTRSSKFIWATFAALVTLLIVAAPRSADLPNRTLIVALWITALIGTIVLYAIGAREKWGERIVFVAFAVVLAYWGALAFAHSRALTQSREEAARIVAPNGESVLRLAAMPTLANPFRWDCVFETDRATYRFPVHLTADNSPPRVIRYEKPAGALAQVLDTVEEQKPARVFLGFARFPVARLADPGCATQTLVQLADLRYTEPGSSRGTFALELPVDCANEPGTEGQMSEEGR